MARPVVAIAAAAPGPVRDAYLDVLSPHAEVVFLAEVAEAERIAALDRAEVLLTNTIEKSLGREALDHLGHLRFIQFITAGIDHVVFADIPDHVPCAFNGGGYADAMVEHVIALMFACALRTRTAHDSVAAGAPIDGAPEALTLSGARCAIIGFGSVGQLLARRLRCLGMRIEAINRSGETGEEVDFIGVQDDLEPVMRRADVIVIAIALTKMTEALIGARELGWTKENAILINVARGEIVDETALYEHLVRHPQFFAGLESWWVEPVRHGVFRMTHPFLDLPNVIGCPHNSPRVPATTARAAAHAAGNVVRLLSGETPRFIVRPEEKMR